MQEDQVRYQILAATAHRFADNGYGKATIMFCIPSFTQEPLGNLAAKHSGLLELLNQGLKA